MALIKFDALPPYNPSSTPISIAEMEAAEMEAAEKTGAFPNMMAPLTDPCPSCKGVMLVGDWVCWGHCYACFVKLDVDTND